MLRLNLFSVLEKMQGLTKESIENAIQEVADHMDSTMENYVKTRIAGEIMTAIAEQFKTTLVKSDFQSDNWNGVTVSRRRGSSKKIYTDDELTKLEEEKKRIQDSIQEELKEIDARIKARKTYLDTIGDVKIVRGSDTLTMRMK